MGKLGEANPDYYEHIFTLVRIATVKYVSHISRMDTKCPYRVINQTKTTNNMELVIGESVKETNRVFNKSYTEEYCKAITENYKLEHIRSMERMLAKDPECTYASKELNDIQTGKANLMKFEIREGKKYYKISS